jgi:hypothetical protein
MQDSGMKRIDSFHCVQSNSWLNVGQRVACPIVNLPCHPVPLLTMILVQLIFSSLQVVLLLACLVIGLVFHRPSKSV